MDICFKKDMQGFTATLLVHLESKTEYFKIDSPPTVR